MLERLGLRLGLHVDGVLGLAGDLPDLDDGVVAGASDGLDELVDADHDAGSKSIVPVLAARLTVSLDTPGTLPSVFSMTAAHDEHVMPMSPSVTLLTGPGAGCAGAPAGAAAGIGAAAEAAAGIAAGIAVGAAAATGPTFGSPAGSSASGSSASTIGSPGVKPAALIARARASSGTGPSTTTVAVLVGVSPLAAITPGTFLVVRVTSFTGRAVHAHGAQREAPVRRGGSVHLGLHPLLHDYLAGDHVHAAGEAVSARFEPRQFDGLRPAPEVGPEVQVCRLDVGGAARTTDRT